jgi:cell division protein FtsL
MNIKYIVIVIIAFFSVYEVFNISYKTQNSREKLLKINSEINKFENDIHILKLEWSCLSNPIRIQVLSDKHLNLEVQTQKHIRKNQTQLVFNNIKKK